ncbi:low affinity immunoglobulin epsilon Fc receptor-like [Drosophila kikkawai]|uniref:Low affinity immunoglobulin epsilon Fc receptor-like n=1 Tax=Drosophila kikkawai TaxID=30033 RepID=A0ABM4GA42_DROKI
MAKPHSGGTAFVITVNLYARRMQNFGIFFLWALAACTLWNGSLANSLRSGYIFLLDDMSPNQSDSICLPELRSMLNDVVQTQNQGNVCDAVNEIKSKLKALEVKSQLQEVQLKLEGQLQGVENKLEGRLQGLERQLQEGQTKMEAKLGESLLAVQGKIENQFQAVLNQLQLVQNKIDSAEVKGQLQAKSNKTAAPQQPAKAAVPALSTITVPSGFELFGTRHFRIVEERADWETAERRCREMGGYLASFRNKEEFNAIKPKLRDVPYWIGINDHAKEGHFVSVASRKPAPFLKWRGQ